MLLQIYKEKYFSTPSIWGPHLVQIFKLFKSSFYWRKAVIFIKEVHFGHSQQIPYNFGEKFYFDATPIEVGQNF